ncbi:KDEL-tailed cysteine endopeptidase CEP3 [Platanthera guangdongensis]|uniref:KDEL-tailed cysteine endopeptidase CEP3 n=1 Tax=Platanthera guangdongensis TaxID=2320717 RepID=A0ABR2LUS5_9ASPA
MHAYLGSCSAFSAVTAVEEIYKITTKKLIFLLVHHLVHCEKMNKGSCVGPYVGAFNFIQKNGIIFEAANIYTTKDGKCVVKENSLLLFIDSYKKVRENEVFLLKVVANLPVSVAIDTHGFDSEDYCRKMFVQNSGTNLDHKMTVVGYRQTLDDIEDWILRNSCGPMYGEGMYMRMLCGASNSGGLCGITTNASYLIIY